MKRDELLQVRLTKDELLVIRGAALIARKSLSELVREAALERALAPAERSVEA